jgi:hypothetical protein
MPPELCTRLMEFTGVENVPTENVYAGAVKVS